MSRWEAFKSAVAGDDRLQAPFNFVDLPNLVIRTPWSKGHPDLATPHKEGLSGELEIRIETDGTPLLVGGVNNEHFFKMHRSVRREDGNTGLSDQEVLTIPGTSVRGLIRATMEAATAARFVLTDLKRTMPIRDSKDKYWSNIARAKQNPQTNQFEIKLSAGWLIPKDPDRARRQKDLKDFRNWKLREADLRILPDNDVKPKGSTLGDFRDWDIRKRYQELGGVKAAKQNHGWLIYTNNERSKNKQKDTEAFFEDIADAAEYELKAPVVQRFVTSHRQSSFTTGGDGGSFDFWWAMFKDEANGLPGIPVFYAGNIDEQQENFTEFGLYLTTSRFPRIPATYTHELLLANYRTEETGCWLDFVQALFGHVPLEDKDGAENVSDRDLSQESFASRVKFGMAFMETGNEPPEVLKEGVTGGPKTSFWPFYLRKGGIANNGKAAIDFNHPDARPAGWKRYPARNGAKDQFPQPAPNEDGVVNNDIKAKMYFRRPPEGSNVSFRGTVRFRNLLPQELGGLIWCLGFGAPDAMGDFDGPHRHMLGRAKSQGYGQVKISLVGEDCRLKPNKKLATAQDFAALVDSFKTYVLESYNQVASGPDTVLLPVAETFEQVPFIADLLAIADPAIGSAAVAINRLEFPTNNDGTKAPLKSYSDIKRSELDTPSGIRLPLYPHSVEG